MTFQFDQFKGWFREMQSDVFTLAHNNGFWDNTDPASPEAQTVKAALIMTEAAEFIESARAGTIWDKTDKDIPLTNGAEELADIVIRVMDLAKAMKIDLADAIVQKHQYNKTRPYKHGKAL